LAAVSETEDPAQVVNKARRAWMTDMPRSCHEFSSNNSGPGSSNESSREVAAPDQIRIVVDRWGGSDPGHSELIVIGSDMYSRIGTGPWRKDSAVGLLTAIPHWLPEALVGETTDRRAQTGPSRRRRGRASLRIRDQVSSRRRSIPRHDNRLLGGANDNLLRKIVTLTKETGPSSGGVEVPLHRRTL
jgi:hypothetical protein